MEGNIVNTYQSKIAGSEMNEFDAYAGFHHANPVIRFTDQQNTSENLQSTKKNIPLSRILNSEISDGNVTNRKVLS